MKTILITVLILLTPVLSFSQISIAPIPECILPQHEGSVELLPCSVTFTAGGEIRVTFRNRGTVGVNTPVSPTLAGQLARRQPAPGPPIRIDVFMQDRLIESVYEQSLSAGERDEIVLKIPSNYTVPRCGERRALRVVIDPQGQIAEHSKANNTLARDSDRPCPDMAIESIKKNANDLKTEYVAQIRIINQGNADARFRYLALTSNSSSFGPIPSADFDKWMEIPAGGGKTFTIGNAFGYDSMYVRVMIDRFNEVAEHDENNNFKEKTLD